MPSLITNRVPSAPAYSSGLSTPQRPYPVLGSVGLEPVRRGWFGRRRRHLQELPDQPPGSTLVFLSDGRYALPPAGSDMLSSDVVVRAVRVEVVSTKREIIAVTKEFAPVYAERSLLLTARFRCHVVDPVLLLEAGVYDAQPDLYEYLSDDDITAAFGVREDAATNPEVALRIVTRHLARRGLEEPHLPGMNARLVDAALRRIDSNPGLHLESDPNGASAYPDDDYGDDPSAANDLTDADPFGDDDDWEGYHAGPTNG